MEQQLIVKAYQESFSLWKQKRLADAEEVLDEFWQETGMKSLRGMLCVV